MLTAVCPGRSFELADPGGIEPRRSLYLEKFSPTPSHSVPQELPGECASTSMLRTYEVVVSKLAQEGVVAKKRRAEPYLVSGNLHYFGSLDALPGN